MYHTHVKGIPFILSQRIEVITKWGITLLIIVKDHGLQKNEGFAPPTIIKNYDLQKMNVLFFIVINNYSL
jgi:hypothetical protein